jgi:hypothetical protein
MTDTISKYLYYSTASSSNFEEAKAFQERQCDFLYVSNMYDTDGVTVRWTNPKPDVFKVEVFIENA